MSKEAPKDEAAKASPAPQDKKEVKDPNEGKIKIVGIRGKDLIVADLDGSSDPYCIVQLMVDGKPHERQYKTKVLASNLNPTWDALEMTWDEPKDAKNVEISIQVWDSDYTYDDFMGQIKLSVAGLKEHAAFTELKNKSDVKDKNRGSLYVSLAGAKKPHLTYFPLYGRAEILRILLNVARVDFEETHIKMEQWPEAKSKQPFGQLPTYKLPSGCVFSESQAIARYLAATNGLYGANHEEQARIDMICETLLDIWTEFAPNFLEFKTPPNVREEKERTGLLDAWHKAKWSKWADQLEASLKLNGNGTGFWVGKTATLADYSFFHRLWLMQKYMPKALEGHKLLSDLYARIGKLEPLATYVKNRADKPF